jgi:SAM-dependent methyltransferase
MSTPTLTARTHAAPTQEGWLRPETAVPAGEASDSLAAAHAAVLAGVPAEGEVAIYEAGGGSSSYLPASVIGRARVTVVDIDPVQLANNRYADVRVEGDIQTKRFPKDSFDLVVCYNVIEHLPDVEAALRRFAECLRPGGMALIGAPNPRSLSGFVTKFTPHWFHVWYYRHVRGEAKAGLPGEPPFPVHYHPLVAVPRLKAFMATLGFSVAYERVYESPRFAELRRQKPGLARVMDAATDLMNAALLNRANVRHGDYHLVLRRDR